MSFGLPKKLYPKQRNQTFHASCNIMRNLRSQVQLKIFEVNQLMLDVEELKINEAAADDQEILSDVPIMVESRVEFISTDVPKVRGRVVTIKDSIIYVNRDRYAGNIKMNLDQLVNLSVTKKGLIEVGISKKIYLIKKLNMK